MTKQVENLTSGENQNKTGRRGFLAHAAMSIGMIASYGTGAVYALQFLFPRKKETRYRRLSVVSLEQLQKDGSKTFKVKPCKEINPTKYLEMLKSAEKGKV